MILEEDNIAEYLAEKGKWSFDKGICPAYNHSLGSEAEKSTQRPIRIDPV
jgi:hypothetical protein